MSFLNVHIIREDKKLTTFVYRKPTSCGVYTHFDSFLPYTYRFGTAYTLAYRCFQIRTSWTKLHTELLSLKHIFLKNGYPENFINFSKRILNIHIVKRLL